MKKTLNIIIFLIIISNIVILLKYKSLKKDAAIALKAQTINHSIFKEINREMIFNVQLNENLTLNKNTLLTNEMDSTFKLSRILDSGEKIVIKNYETGCSSCFEQELKQLKNISSIIGKNNIIVITTHKASRKLLVFRKTYNIDFDIYYCDTFELPFDKEGRLYTFVSDSTLTVKHFFVPNPEMPELSVGYYSAICKRYFSKLSKLTSN